MHRHVVAVLAFDGVVGFDLSIPCQVFSSTRHPRGGRPYEVWVCGDREGIDATADGAYVFGITPTHDLHAALDADTILIPGGFRGTEPWTGEATALLRKAHANGTRIMSICTGAFLLAASGLLNGRRATTHWAHAGGFAERFPAVRLDPDVLFIDDGDILTSAGVAAGLDLCLHVVRLDHGAAVAAATARSVVMPLQRAGGQAQFIAYEVPGDEGGTLEPTMRWMQENLDRPLTLEEVARHAAVSVRTLNRRFRERTGSTPLQWLIRQRIARAQHLLETTDLRVEAVAGEAGFGTAVAMRRHFARLLGTSPNAYRRAFLTR
jgi:transcriptional regulator GlxA family with amidase domain